jgi:hypothetical protein
MSGKDKTPSTPKGQRRCITTKCQTFFSSLDPHAKCEHCTPRVCDKTRTCVFCALPSEAEWAAWAKQSKSKRKIPTTSVPPKESLAPPKEPAVVVGLVDKGPDTGPAQTAGNSGSQVPSVPATPDTRSRISGLESSVGSLRTDMASMFEMFLGKLSNQLKQPHLPVFPVNPGEVPGPCQGLSTQSTSTTRPGLFGRTPLGSKMAPGMGHMLILLAWIRPYKGPALGPDRVSTHPLLPGHRLGPVRVLCCRAWTPVLVH